MPVSRWFTYVYLLAWSVFAFLPYVYFSTKGYVFLLAFFSGSAIYMSMSLARERYIPIYFKLLFVLVFFLSIYGFYDLVLGNTIYWKESGRIVENNRYLLWLMTSMLSVVPAYVFTCKGFLREFEMKCFFFIMLAASIYAFNYMNKMFVLEALSTGSKQEEFTITAVYCFLSIFPLVLLFKKSIVVQFLLICVFLFYFIQSAKRGPILLGSLCVLLMIVKMFFSCTKWKKMLLCFLSALFLVFLYRYISYQIEASPYFAMRVEQTLDGYTSGREEYARFLLDYFISNPSIKNFFLGMGAQSTLDLNESFAHNDWIAILIEQGVIGFVIYLIYWIGYFVTWFRSRIDFEAHMAISMLVIIGFGKTLFSMYYLPVAADVIASSGTYAIVLGFFLGKAFSPKENLLVELKGVA